MNPKFLPVSFYLIVFSSAYIYIIPKIKCPFQLRKCPSCDSLLGFISSDDDRAIYLTALNLGIKEKDHESYRVHLPKHGFDTH